MFKQNCEDCAYFVDGECVINLDEDEYERFLQSNKNDCPYFKFYDEYKMVAKQN